MLRKILLFIALAFVCTTAKAQDYTQKFSFVNVKIGGPGANTSFANTGVNSFAIFWNPATTVATCAVQVDSSSDGITWGSGDLIGSQNCATAGSSTTVSLASGKNYVRVNVTALTGNGGLDVTLKGWGGAGGGGSSANPSSANAIDPSQPPYSVIFDAKSGVDGTTVNGQNTLASTNQSCVVGDVGKLIVSIGTSNGLYAFGTGLVTVTGCSGASWTASVNAGVNAGVNQNWFIGSIGGGTFGDNGTAMAAAFAASIAANKQLALPCGAGVFTNPPFPPPAAGINFILTNPDIQGCMGTGGTHFILHPQITAGVLALGGNFFASFPGPATGTATYQGLGLQGKISNIFITALNGALPGTAGKTYTLINEYHGLDNIAIQAIGMTAGTWTLANLASGEAHFHKLNFQNLQASLANSTGVNMTGQGINLVDDSIFAFGATAATCGGTFNCVFSNDYITGDQMGIIAQTGSTVTVIGSQISVVGGNGSQGAISDAGSGATFYIFGNPLIQTTQANFPAIRLPSVNDVLDMSGTNLTSLTAGCQIFGAGRVNDRAGNTPFVLNGTSNCAFTGTYVPIGGGSVAVSNSSAATNVGSVLTGVNIVAASPGNATYDTKIGFRQVTLGTTCSAGSNTVNGVLSWTSGGIAQATGSGGVPALPTLTISANGAVGTSSAYTSVAIHVDVNTAVTFTTTSTLASTGCTIVPQYVVDYSNI